MNEPIKVETSRTRLWWHRFHSWAWDYVYPVCRAFYFPFLYDEYKLKGNKWLLGLRECIWTYMCGHSDFIFALKMGNIWWEIGKK